MATNPVDEIKRLERDRRILCRALTRIMAGRHGLLTIEEMSNLALMGLADTHGYLDGFELGTSDQEMERLTMDAVKRRYGQGGA